MTEEDFNFSCPILQVSDIEEIETRTGKEVTLQQMSASHLTA